MPSFFRHTAKKYPKNGYLFGSIEKMYYLCKRNQRII